MEFVGQIAVVNHRVVADYAMVADYAIKEHAIKSYEHVTSNLARPMYDGTVCDRGVLTDGNRSARLGVNNHAILDV